MCIRDRLEVVRRKAEELQLALQIHCSGGQAAVSLSGSTGVAIRRPGESVVSLYARADKALYKAKAQGRNGYYIDAEGADIKPEKSGGRAAGAAVSYTHLSSAARWGHASRYVFMTRCGISAEWRTYCCRTLRSR